MCAVVVQIRLQSFYVDLGRIGTGHARSTVVFLGIVSGDYYLTMRFILTRLSRIGSWRVPGDYYLMMRFILTCLSRNGIWRVPRFAKTHP